MVDEVPPPTPAPAKPWWTVLYSPAMLSAIAMLITAVAGVVGAAVQKQLRKQEKDKK